MASVVSLAKDTTEEDEGKLIGDSWMVGPNWPDGGEIDIIEGVNSQTSNDMTLHTDDGCSISNTGNFSGSIATSNCYVDAVGQSANAGCQITSGDSATYGTGFNSNGGGVYATEWTSDAISIWFFPRGSIPPDITSGSPDPSGWSAPQASFSGSCDIDEHFQNQQIVSPSFQSPMPILTLLSGV